jgi:hypothetical protein
VAAATLFPGPSPIDTTSGVWAAGDEVSWFFDLGVGGGTAASAQGTVDASGDASGAAWFAEPGGLVRVQPGPTVTHFLLPSEARPRGNPASDVTWVQSDGSAWRHRADAWSRLEGLPDDVAVVGVDHAGRLLLAGEGGLVRADPERHLLLLGLEDGAHLEDLTRYVLPAPFGATPPLQIVAEIDGSPAEVTEDGIRLDPAALSDGAHALSVEAVWQDGEGATASLFFSVGEFVPPTWSDDIEPLFERSCTPCHAPAGGAHLLDNPLAWQAEINDILDETTTARMPLNNGTNPNFTALSDADLDVIGWWRAGGFLP